MDAASSDACSLGCDGPVARCETCVCLLALASTSIVCADEFDCTVGSDSGVDDHTIKFPSLCEATVWACVVSCCVGNVFALDLVSVSDFGWYEAWTDGCVVGSLVSEPWSSEVSVV